MLQNKIQLLVVVAAVICGQAPALAEYGYTTPATYSQDSPYRPTPAAESKSYKEDDSSYHRPYGESRTGPPKKVIPGPGPGLSYSNPSLPLSYPHHGHSHRLLPAGSVIGYLAYPQPLLHEPTPGLLPSAAFSHLAYAAPLALSPYKPYSPGPSYSSYSSSPHSTSFHH